MSNVRDCTYGPAAQADGPPRIWGVEMTPMHRGSSHEARVAGRSLTIAGTPEFGACVYWGGGVLKIIPAGSTWPKTIGAIETELTRIETEIRTAREGKK